MQINISTRHGQISDPTREKIHAKLEKLPRLFDRVSAIELTINLEHRDSPTVDLQVSVEHKHEMVAASRAVDLLAAVDDVMEKMEQQLRRHKDKVRDRHRNPSHRQLDGVPAPESP
ncbi:MAG: ribosome hibernation-promoting factor, HPF/YfiA family [Thermoguttaceae bacterium]